MDPVLVQLSDFGCAIRLDEVKHDKAGYQFLHQSYKTKLTPHQSFNGIGYYTAPEFFRKQSDYTVKIDMWSLGVTLFEMCVSRWQACSARGVSDKTAGSWESPHLKTLNTSFYQMVLHSMIIARLTGAVYPSNKVLPVRCHLSKSHETDIASHLSYQSTPTPCRR